MSAVSKSKSKSASIAKKEQPKSSLIPSNGPTTTGNNVSLSNYIPVLGMSHLLEKALSSIAETQDTGRFQGLDDEDNHSGTSFDSMSNTLSCSGESEDPNEKTATSPPRQTEPVPGSNSDKREKIRQKNEKKHQRQREKRAQELHERCCSYLMSRKLGMLSQKLLAMGFSLEQVRAALLLNNGHAEQSVAWLTEVGEEKKQEIVANLDGIDLKIDISEELSRISEMEIRFKCTKQEVERAIIASEGDLDKTADNLKAQKEITKATSEKLGGADDYLSLKDFTSKPGVSGTNTIVRTQMNGTAPLSIQKVQIDSDRSYIRPGVTGVAAQNFVLNKNMQSLQSLRIQQAGPEHPMPQEASLKENCWLSASSSLPLSYTAPTMSVSSWTMRPEAQLTMLDCENKLGTAAWMPREPVNLMQRPQSVNGKQNVPATNINGLATSPPSTGWYQNGLSNMDVWQMMTGSLGQVPPGLHFGNSTHHVLHNQFQQFMPRPVESKRTGQVGLGSIARSASSSSLGTPSSLGLFSNPSSRGSFDSLSAIDWSTIHGPMPPIDYCSIDWSLDSTNLRNDWQSATRPVESMGYGATKSLNNMNNINEDSITPIGLSECISPFEGKDPRQYVASPSL